MLCSVSQYCIGRSCRSTKYFKLYQQCCSCAKCSVWVCVVRAAVPACLVHQTGASLAVHSSSQHPAAATLQPATQHSKYSANFKVSLQSCCKHIWQGRVLSQLLSHEIIRVIQPSCHSPPSQERRQL